MKLTIADASKLLVNIGLLCIPLTLCAAETLDSVIARLAHQDSVQIRYWEVRHLALMSEPWKGTGYFYAKPPGHLVKLQLQPSREVMAISDDYMWYFSAENNIRLHASIDDMEATGREVATFQALLNGDLSRLRSVFALHFDSDDRRWTIDLQALPNNSSKLLPEIAVSGPVGGRIERILLTKPDGDFDEIRLGESQRGETVANTIDALLLEVRGE